ncbi:MAG: hypothetical protein MI674_07925, partial [Cytophagales bacterium]|nr:hypothetical protein [Cytophagales bacterium]
LVGLFLTRSVPWLFTTAPARRFVSSSYKALTAGPPPSHLQQAKNISVYCFVTHPSRTIVCMTSRRTGTQNSEKAMLIGKIHAL